MNSSGFYLRRFDYAIDSKHMLIQIYVFHRAFVICSTKVFVVASSTRTIEEIHAANEILRAVNSEKCHAIRNRPFAIAYDSTILLLVDKLQGISSSFSSEMSVVACSGDRTRSASAAKFLSVHFAVSAFSLFIVRRIFFSCRFARARNAIIVVCVCCSFFHFVSLSEEIKI